MATDRVGIEIEVMGYEEALQHMKTLESSMKGLSGRKNYLKVKAEVEDLKMSRNAMKQQRIKIKADMTQVDKEIKRLKALLKSLEGQKSLYGKGSPAMEKLLVQIGRVKNELASLEQRRSRLGNEFQEASSQINNATASIQRMEAALRNAGGASKSLMQIFKSMSSMVAHVGSAMQSAGNAIMRLANPLRMITNGAMLGAGYKALNTVTEGLSSGFKRYDIMKKYPKMMAEYSKASFTAADSIKKLDQAVRGLPTGLDEIVDMTQRFTLSLGDMRKGTDLAIATNNAFLASMASEAQQYQGMMQIQDLANGKKLNSREWMSLGASMGKAINEVGKELGYSSDEMGEFRQALYSGQIATDDFLNALIKVGTGTGKIAQLAENSKATWEAFTANVRNAFSRMTFGILESIDELTMAGTGKTLNQLLGETVPNGIDKMTNSAKKWIKAHPEEIKSFFKDLKAIDWKGLGKGFLEGVGTIAKGIHAVAKALKGKDLETFGKMIAFLAPLGNSLLVIGGLFKGGRHIAGGIAALTAGLGRLFGGVAIGKAFTKFSTSLKGLLGMKAATDTAETAAKTVAKKSFNLKGYFATIGKALGGIAAVGGGILMVGGTVLLSIKMVKSIVKDLGTISADMKNIDSESMKKLGKWMGVIGGALAGLGAITGLSGGGMGVAASVEAGVLAVGAIITTITGLAWINSKLIASSMKNFLDAVNSVNKIIKALNKLVGANVNFDIGKISENASKIGTAVRAVYDAVNKAFAPQQGRETGRNRTRQMDLGAGMNRSGNAKNMASMVTSITTTLQQLRGAYDALAGARGLGTVDMSTIDVAVQNAQTLIRGIGRIATTLVGMPTANMDANMESVKNAVNKIRSVARTLNTLGGKGGNLANTKNATTAISNIKKIISKLANALDAGLISQLKGKVDTFRTAVKSLFNTLNNDLANVNVKVTIKGSVKGQKALIAKIKAADRAIRRAVANIKTSYNKTIHVNLNPSVHRGKMPNTSYPHTGGYVAGNGKLLYRSKGGGVPNIFKPKGTDVVPAMLSHGEYVHKAKAVDYFGVEFMRRINNLDIAGALRELSARAGAHITSSRGTVINNNITNNNSPTVNQKVYTNNPNFAFKRSNRYVTAL